MMIIVLMIIEQIIKVRSWKNFIPSLYKNHILKHVWSWKQQVNITTTKIFYQKKTILIFFIFYR